MKGNVLDWVVGEIVKRLARRWGGQAAAALVALSMDAQYESTAAAIIAWAIVSVAELAASAGNRKAIMKATAKAMGR